MDTLLLKFSESLKQYAEETSAVARRLEEAMAREDARIEERRQKESRYE